MNQSKNELRSHLLHLNEEYRAGNPLVSDAEYDKLVEELYSLDPNDEFFSRGVVESQPSDSRKVKLPIKSMSLDKFKTIEFLEQWSCREQCIVMPKYDGITIVIDTRGENVSFITRGDGEVGRDCTEHLQHLKSCFRELKGIFRGELIITNNTWNQYKETIFREYTSPRNTVAGWINGDYDQTVRYDLLTLVIYQWYEYDEDELYFDTLCRLDNHFEGSKILTPDVYLVKGLFIREDFKQCFDELKEFYPIDGLVIYKNKTNKEFRATHINGNPMHIKAYKDPIFSEERETIIESITWNMNRFGILTPVVNIKPISISNALVSKVNGISASYIIDMHLKPGNKITVKRSGEVIPKIVKSCGVNIPFVDEFTSTKEYNKKYDECIKTIEALNPREMEDFIDDMICPYCGESLKMDSVNIFCENEECEEREFQSMFKFFEIMGLDEYKEISFRSIWNKGFRSINQFLDLEVKDLLSIEGWGQISSEHFVYKLNQIKTSEHSIEKIAHATGCFPSLAIKTSTIIFDYLIETNILKIESGQLLRAKCLILPEDLCKIDGIGSSKAQLFCSKFNDFTEFLQKHSNWLRIEDKTVNNQVKTGKFSGLSFCFTGFRNKELEQQIKELGGSIASGVSKKLSYLVVKDKSSTSSKMETAKKNGIKIIDINELNNLM